MATETKTEVVEVHDEATSVWARIAATHGLTLKRAREIVLNTLMPRKDGKLVPTEADMAAALLVADKYQLNPFLREIFFTPGKGGGILSIVGVDGWFTLANRHPQCDGFSSEDIFDEKGDLIAVKSIIHRKDRAHPVEVTEYMAECKRGTDPWRQSPRRMLRHRAMIQGIRYAFGIGGIMEADEAEAMMEQPTPVKAMRTLSDVSAKLSSRQTNGAGVIDVAGAHVTMPIESATAPVDATPFPPMSHEESVRLDREAADAEAQEAAGRA